LPRLGWRISALPTLKGARVQRDPLFPRLKDFAIQRTAMSYWADKDDALADTVARLLDARHLPLDQLMARLAAEGGQGPETDALIDAVTVGETFFFRYRAQFDALERHVLPQVLARNRDQRQLAVWSAGCSNGAEPYSFAIMLERSFGVQLAGWRVDILGTDISRGALAEAAAGCYSDWTVRDLPEESRKECFERTGGCWRVKNAYRRRVRFMRHSLVADPPPLPRTGRFDIILCRNVLMYFDAPTRDRVLAGFRHALADQGWLVLGYAEAGPQAASHFVTETLPDCTLYRMPGPPPPPPRAEFRPAKRAPQARATALPANSNPEIYVRTLLDQGEFARAATLCRAWVASAPMDPAAHYYLGLAVEPLSEDQAIAALRRALFLGPHLAVVHFALLRIFQRRGDRVQARRHYVAVMADLSELSDDQRLPLGINLTAGELAAVARRIGGGA